MRTKQIAEMGIVLLLLAGCATEAQKKSLPPSPGTTNAPPSKYYLDDGPLPHPPPHLDQVPNAVPKVENYDKYSNKPYTVFGRVYVPDVSTKPFVQTGLATWYGKRFHKQKTSNGEVYDMYAMTAAHTTLPIPSYAKVTNLKNNKWVIVRINDRGPFHSDRIIDLSYTAAYQLGFVNQGSAQVRVERVFPKK